MERGLPERDDASRELRLQSGGHRRGIDDPNCVVVRTTRGNPQQAHAHFESSDLKNGMQNAGVASTPTMDVLEEAR
ncbi:MAG: hypothetical protein ACYDCK_01745 [Thermoplasmatota archaeon]